MAVTGRKLLNLPVVLHTVGFLAKQGFGVSQRRLVSLALAPFRGTNHVTANDLAPCVRAGLSPARSPQVEKDLRHRSDLSGGAPC